VSGVAPGADLGVYRVFGCRGGTADDVLLKALQKACASGADVITVRSSCKDETFSLYSHLRQMSIGSPAAWSDTPTARMATSIAAKGRIVTVSAGNDGDVGEHTASCGLSSRLTCFTRPVLPELAFRRARHHVRRERKQRVSDRLQCVGIKRRPRSDCESFACLSCCRS
jgi:hypothetical protein